MIAVLALLLASSVQAGQTIDRLLAVVAGDPIFLSDVRQAETLKLIDNGGTLAQVTAMTGAPAAQMPLEQLINRRLVLAEVTRYQQPAPLAADLDRALETWSARFSNEAARDAAIESAAGGSRAAVRAFLADSLRIDRYLDQRFAAAAAPTRDEVAAGGSDARRLALVRDWLAALRNRATVQVVSSERER